MEKIFKKIFLNGYDYIEFVNELLVDVSSDDYGIHLSCNSFNIHSFCYKNENIETAFANDVKFYYDEYKDKSDNELTDYAKNIKNNLIENVLFKTNYDEKEFTFEDFLHS